MQDIGNINHKLVQKPTGGYTLAETDITPSDNTRVVTPSLSAFTTQRPEIREASAEGFTPFGTMQLTPNSAMYISTRDFMQQGIEVPKEYENSNGVWVYTDNQGKYKIIKPGEYLWGFGGNDDPDDVIMYNRGGTRTKLFDGATYTFYNGPDSTPIPQEVRDYGNRLIQGVSDVKNGLVWDKDYESFKNKNAGEIEWLMDYSPEGKSYKLRDWNTNHLDQVKYRDQLLDGYIIGLYNQMAKQHGAPTKDVGSYTVDLGDAASHATYQDLRKAYEDKADKMNVAYTDETPTEELVEKTYTRPQSSLGLAFTLAGMSHGDQAAEQVKNGVRQVFYYGPKRIFESFQYDPNKSFMQNWWNQRIGTLSGAAKMFNGGLSVTGAPITGYVGEENLAPVMSYFDPGKYAAWIRSGFAYAPHNPLNQGWYDYHFGLSDKAAEDATEIGTAAMAVASGAAGRGVGKLTSRAVNTVGEGITRSGISPHYFPRVRFYSDNPWVNAWATAARRLNWSFADKARLPYLIRSVRSTDVNVNNGSLDLSGNKHNYINVTYDVKVPGHNKGNWDTSQQTLLLNGRTLIPENTWLSIEPTDMFTSDARRVTIPTSDVIDITGSSPVLKAATEAGMETRPLSKLIEREQVEEAFSTSPDNTIRTNSGSGLDVYRRPKSSQTWYDIVQGEINKFGRPFEKDIRLLEEETGLDSGIQPLSAKVDLENAFKVDDGSIFRFGNGTPATKSKLEISRKVPYRNFFYDPATWIENTLKKQGYFERPEAVKLREENTALSVKDSSGENAGSYIRVAKNARHRTPEEVQKDVNDRFMSLDSEENPVPTGYDAKTTDFMVKARQECLNDLVFKHSIRHTFPGDAYYFAQKNGLTDPQVQAIINYVLSKPSNAFYKFIREHIPSVYRKNLETMSDNLSAAFSIDNRRVKYDGIDTSGTYICKNPVSISKLKEGVRQRYFDDIEALRKEGLYSDEYLSHIVEDSPRMRVLRALEESLKRNGINTSDIYGVINRSDGGRAGYIVDLRQNPSHPIKIMMEQIKDSGQFGLTQEQIQAMSQAVTDKLNKVYPTLVYFADRPSTVGGYYDLNTGRSYANIRNSKNEGALNSTVTHENIGHRTESAIHPSIMDRYQKAADVIVDGEPPIYADSAKGYELRTTLLEFKEKVNPTGDLADLKKTVQNMSDSELLNTLKGLNGYGGDYVRAASGNAEKIKIIRDAMKLPSAILAAYLGLSAMDDEEDKVSVRKHGGLLLCTTDVEQNQDHIKYFW